MDSIRKIPRDEFPKLLLEINDPPETLWLEGELPGDDFIFLAVVGSRKYTDYGKTACEYLIRGLSGYKIAIVSGLALGIDAVAHQTAIEIGLPTVAVPGSGLSREVLYPRMNVSLAEEILHSGGALLSEFEPNFKATEWSFPKRNRLMAGMSQATLIIEAEEKSGTLITARLALDYNRDVLAVPGEIFSENSRGTNRLIKEGALAVSYPLDIVRALGLPEKDSSGAEINTENLSADEKTIWEILKNPNSKDELLEGSKLSAERLNVAIALLEIKGLIQENLGEIRRLG